MKDGALVERVEVVSPYFDYVGPELVDVYITNECVLPAARSSDDRADGYLISAATTRPRRCTGASSLRSNHTAHVRLTDTHVCP